MQTDPSGQQVSEHKKAQGRIRKRLLAASVLLLLVPIMVLGLDQRLETTRYTYVNPKIPSGFENYRVAFISDLHCKSFGKNQKDLLAALHAEKPDMLVLTGDVVDETHRDISPVEDLLRGMDGTPVYYVTGNHDLEVGAAAQYRALLKLFDQYHTVDLDDASTALTIGQDHIYLHGQKYRSRYISHNLQPADPYVFNILLYHGSDNFDLIQPFGYDLVLSGHAHGGVVRLPLLGGVFGNDGDLFPKYAGGVYTKDGVTLISSRGLGDAALPRFNNRPQLIIITLKGK